MNDDMRVGNVGDSELDPFFNIFISFLLLVPVCQSVIDIEPLTYQTRPRDYHGDRLMHAE